MISQTFELLLAIFLSVFSNFIVFILCISIQDSCQLEQDDELFKDSTKFQCFMFPETNPVIFEGTRETFAQKTTYIQARKEIRKHFNSTLPQEIAMSSSTPIYLYFLGRHTIRYPMDREMSVFMKILPQLKEMMLSSGKLKPKVAEELRNWQLLMHPSEAARVTQSGKHETAIIARYFYSLFPQLLNVNTTAFEVNHTSLVRTKETSEAFVRSLAEVQSRNCSHTFEQSNNQAETFFSQICSQMKVNDEVLLSHKREHRRKAQREEDALRESSVIKAMVRQFCERNGLVGEMASFENVETLRRIASYEMAHHRYSPFAYLFTIKELQVMEYLYDLSWYRVAYGHTDHKAGTIVTSDLCRKLHEVIKSPPSDGHTKATLYFSHDGLFKRLLGYFGLFKYFPPYQLRHNRLYISKERQWRVSYLFPFGTNLCVVLFRCGGKHKLLTLYNEIPVTLEGMTSALTDLEDFLVHYNH